jgi:hypothetical protein
MVVIKTDKNVGFSADNLAYAPKKLITQLRGQMRSWAFEDGIAPNDLNKYILNNINIELDALGYHAIEKL